MDKDIYIKITMYIVVKKLTKKITIKRDMAMLFTICE